MMDENFMCITDAEAYVLLAHDVARDAKTIFCVTDSMFNLAILNVDAADVIYNQVGARLAG